MKGLRAIQAATESTLRDRSDKAEASVQDVIKKNSTLEEKVTYLQVRPHRVPTCPHVLMCTWRVFLTPPLPPSRDDAMIRSR